MTMLLEEVLPYLREGRKARLFDPKSHVKHVVFFSERGFLKWTPEGKSFDDSKCDLFIVESDDRFELISESFDFQEAVRRLRAGKQVAPESWKPGIFLHEEDGGIQLSYPHGGEPWCPNLCDIEQRWKEVE